MIVPLVLPLPAMKTNRAKIRTPVIRLHGAPTLGAYFNYRESFYRHPSQDKKFLTVPDPTLDYATQSDEFVESFWTPPKTPENNLTAMFDSLSKHTPSHSPEHIANRAFEKTHPRGSEVKWIKENSRRSKARAGSRPIKRSSSLTRLDSEKECEPIFLDDDRGFSKLSEELVERLMMLSLSPKMRSVSCELLNRCSSEDSYEYWLE